MAERKRKKADTAVESPEALSTMIGRWFEDPDNPNDLTRAAELLAMTQATLAKIDIDTDIELDERKPSEKALLEIIKLLNQLSPGTRHRVLRTVVVYFLYGQPREAANMMGALSEIRG